MNDPDTVEALNLIGALAVLLPNVKEWLAGMTTLSSEMAGTIGLILPVGDVNDALDDVLPIAALAGALAGACPHPSVSGPATAIVVAMGANLPGFPPYVPLPVYEPYADDAKLASEPLAGAGDFDGDGLSNAAVAAIISGQGGDANDFVVAASGGFGPFWEGNPALPVGGMVGLGALFSALGAAGAVVLRRKK